MWIYCGVHALYYSLLALAVIIIQKKQVTIEMIRAVFALVLTG